MRDLADRIIDHPFQPHPLDPDVCGYQYPTGWPCGYTRDEHQGADDA